MLCPICKQAVVSVQREICGLCQRKLKLVTDLRLIAELEAEWKEIEGEGFKDNWAISEVKM